MGNHQLNIEQERYSIPKKTKTFLMGMILVGLILSIIGFFAIPRGEHHDEKEGHASVETHETLHAGMQATEEHDVEEHATDDTEANHAETHDEDGTDEHATDETEEHAAGAHETDEIAAHNDQQNEIVGDVVGTKIDCGVAGCPDPAHNHHAYNAGGAHGDHHAKPWYTRVYTALLMNSYYILLISLGGLFFYCVQYVANAGWATALLRIPQGMYSFFIIPAVVVMLVVYFAGGDIYHWVAYQAQNILPGEEGFDKILHGKKWFLNKQFVFGVVPACMVIWYIIGMRLKALANKEDKEGGTWSFSKSIRSSAAFMVLFGFTFSFLAWLVIMSIDAHWFSTIFGIYHFAILWVSSLSVIMLIALHLRRNGYIKILKDDHIHDLAKFMFAFSVFWMYIWIAQYLLIWYANIPEESIYYTMRQDSSYHFFFVINVVINFIAPFLLFMTRDGKRNPKIITFVAIAILVGHWNDLYLSIYPGVFNGEFISPGLMEIGLFLVFGGIFVWWTLAAIAKRNLIAINHPYIEESATHDVGV